MSCNNEEETAQYDAVNNSKIEPTAEKHEPIVLRAYRVRKILKEFLELYGTLPALWKVKSKEYTNRRCKSAAYDTLVQKYRELEPDADREQVKKKINSFRTNYRKELHKIASQPSYTPTLWYYHQLSFLREQEAELAAEKAAEDDDCSGESRADETVVIQDTGFKVPRDNLRQEPRGSPTQAPQKRPVPCDLPSTTRLSCKLLTCNHVEDEYDLLARTWAMELRKLRPDQQIFAKKAVSDVLFEAQLATLSRDSVRINEDRTVHEGQTVYSYESTMMATQED